MMETLEIVVEDTILPHDRDLIGKETERIVWLINQNPFAGRIWDLLLNPEIARKPVVNKKDLISTPNCIGTAFFVAGVSSLGYPYHAYSFELDPHMDHPRPEKDPDLRSTTFCQHDERRIPGAFCFSYCVRNDDWHAGIYLGRVNDEHISFAQNGHGGDFCLQNLRGNYACPNFYIPKTLLGKGVKA
jgi:hypothetical protein